MKLIDLFRKKSSAPVARDRLQVLLSHERSVIGKSDLIAVLQEEILAASKAGSTILFSTHVMEHAERLCTRLLMLARGTRAWKIFSGLAVFVGIFLLSDLLQFRTLNWLLRQIVPLAPVALVILFYPELRYALEEVGRVRVPRIRP